jgi:lipopolysaccharide/colanic/teichoic acid biosynthesis glycosyltransferase
VAIVPVAVDPVAERCAWVLSHPRRSGAALDRHDRIARVRDLFVLALSAPLWVPATAAIAAAIKLEHRNAPVLFTQSRTGRHGMRFNAFKFRSMVPNAEDLKHELRHLNELEWPDFKITNDPRVTRVGRFIRATGLDELPQLLNVVRGDMALVGPRPTSFAPETYEAWQTERLDAPPGVTGLWQVTGRAETMFDDRVRLEIAYVRRRSMWLDLIIMTKTVPALLKGEGK